MILSIIISIAFSSFFLKPKFNKLVGDFPFILHFSTFIAPTSFFNILSVSVLVSYGLKSHIIGSKTGAKLPNFHPFHLFICSLISLSCRESSKILYL